MKIFPYGSLEHGKDASPSVLFST